MKEQWILLKIGRKNGECCGVFRERDREPLHGRVETK